MNKRVNALQSGEYLRAGFSGSRFDEEWERLTKRFAKYEGRQHYEEGEESGFPAFLKGDFVTFAENLLASRREDAPFFAAAQARGVSFVRIHALSTPFTPYMEFEFYSYLLGQQMGEKILYVAQETVNREIGDEVPDFNLFDHSAVSCNDFDSHGKLRGAWFNVSPDVVREASAIFDSLLPFSIPFQTAYVADPAILQFLGIAPNALLH